MKGEGTKTVNAILKTKNKVEVISPPNFKLQNKVIVSRQCNIGKKKDIWINRMEQRVQKQTHKNIANSFLTQMRKLFNEEIIAFSTNSTEQLVMHSQKKKINLDLNFSLYAKLNSKWISDLNIDAKL